MAFSKTETLAAGWTYLGPLPCLIQNQGLTDLMIQRGGPEVGGTPFAPGAWVLRPGDDARPSVEQFPDGTGDHLWVWARLKGKVAVRGEGGV